MKKIIIIICGIICLISAVIGYIQIKPKENIQNNSIIEQAPSIEVEEPELEIIQPASRSLGIYKITAYCGCEKCCGKTDGVTASGTRVTAGRTIAAPPEISFGTKLIINGHTYIVEDRGSAIQGKRIDIYFESHQEALDFGVQYIEVFQAP